MLAIVVLKKWNRLSSQNVRMKLAKTNEVRWEMPYLLRATAYFIMCQCVCFLVCLFFVFNHLLYALNVLRYSMLLYMFQCVIV